ncbi:MAG TPA: J domain-containing protein [Actinomycetota bacterium]|nr:J domain-containing protein [Actinomycetota bacterium]
MARDHYSALGVSEEASPEEIKRAFRSLARQHHPDATGNDPEAAERYKEISEAYSVLSDPSRRREYDMQRAGGFTQFGTTIEDLFDSFFGGGSGRRSATRQRSRAWPGESIGARVSMDFRESVFGASKTIRLDRLQPCPRCQSSGCEPGTFPQTCERCDGTGELQQVRRTVLGSMMTAYPCAACRQTGWVIPDPCSSCRGEGRAKATEEVTAQIPPGVESGDRMVMRDQGNAGVAGGSRGDLYVEIAVEPDERFERRGDEILTWVDIPMTTAALGGEVTFESLDGTEKLNVPKGAQSGEEFRIRERGMVRRYGDRGDLVVHANVVTPTGLTDEQERLLAQLAELRGEPRGGHGILAGLRRALRMEG